MNLDWDRIRKRRLYLASPLYGNQLNFGFHRSVCQLLSLAGKNRVFVGQKCIGCDSLVPRARNVLVHHFLDSDCTDMLYVDADISFSPEDAFSLMESDLPILGGVYPRKQIDWERIRRAAIKGVPSSDLPRYGFIPVMNWPSEGDYPLDRAFPVKHLGTGFIRIRREVFEGIMAKLGDKIAYDYANEQTNLVVKSGQEFFPIGPDMRYPLGSGGRQYLSEDWAFSEMARQCGFIPFADPRIKLTHSGNYDYVGDLSVMDAAIEEEFNDIGTPEGDEFATIP